MDQRLDPLIVPILPRRQARVLGAPRDQFLLGVEAQFDEAARGDRIEHQQRRDIVFGRRQAADEPFLPGFARTIAALRVPAAEEDADCWSR